MTAIDWDFLIALLLTPVFGLLAVLYLQRRDWRQLNQVDLPHLVYLILNMLWALGVLFGHGRIRDLPPFVLFMRLAPYLLVYSPSLLVPTTTDLVRRDQSHRRWLLIVPLPLLMFALFHDGNIRPNLAENLLFGARTFDREGLWHLIMITAEMIPIVAAYQLTRELYRKGWGLVYHNRLRYWFLILALITMGDLLALIFSYPDLVYYLGGLIRLGGITLATAALIIPYLPATHLVFRRSLNVLSMGLIMFGILFVSGDQEDVIVGSAAVAAIVAIIYLPLNRRVKDIIDRLVLGQQGTLRNILAEYHRQISKQLNLEQLAETVINLLDSALHLDADEGDSALITAHVSDQGAVMLSPITRSDRSDLPDLLCRPGSPLATYWRESRIPLAQFDTEVLPDFFATPKEERECLAQWRSKIYVPLHLSDRLVGALALGAKRSGKPYSPAEIRFLSGLVSQTALAVEQAQLLSDLKTANMQLTSLSDELALVNRRLYEANRLKSGFISVITHELRSPFVPIAFSLQLIERLGLEHLMPEQQRQLDEVTKGITELKQMVDHIIAFASLLSKQGDLKMESIELGPLVAEMVEGMQPMAKTREISLDARVWPGLPPVQGDRERLAEAIYHLVHNGIKFNRPEGWVRVRCQPDNGSIEVRVQDSGIGIPAGKLDHLWSEFSQMADPLRRGVEGLGLGLALVRYVVIAHGGEVWAESTVGQGSTFGFKIPTTHPQSQTPPSELQ